MSAAVPVNSAKRDWDLIIRELGTTSDSMGQRISMQYIASKCGRNKRTVLDWCNGVEPKESDARIVLALYAKYLPQSYIQHQAMFAIRVDLPEEQPINAPWARFRGR